jgi:hypothetical protein
LSAESLLLLELVLSVGESAALVFLEVLASLTLEPELAQLGLDLFLPCVLGARLVGPERLGAHERVHSRRVEIFIEIALVI